MSAESEATSPKPLLRCLQEKLSSCSESIGGGDEESSVSELIEFLDSVLEPALSQPGNDVAQRDAFEVLSAIRTFLLSPSLDQFVIDSLSFELPKAVSKFAGLSDPCLEVADCVIDRLIATCNPRDMLSILCEALDSSCNLINPSGCVAALLSGLAKVILSIQRRHYEQVKVAVPVILNVLKAVVLELGDQVTECLKLFVRALNIANSMHEVCEKLEGRLKEKLRALLGLYILQILALVSGSIGHEIPTCLSLVLNLSHFFLTCNLSYHRLITGSDVDLMTSVIVGIGEEDAFMSCFSDIKLGACLSVIWGYISDGVSHAAGENLSVIVSELQINQANRWLAISMLKHIFSSVTLPWELKKHAIDFLLCIINVNVTQENNNEDTDCSMYIPGLCAALQAIITVIMYAPNTMLRKNSFEALKSVLADIPISQRFDTLQALVTNSHSPSMIAILLDCLRRELHINYCQRTAAERDVLQAANQLNAVPSLWTPGALKLVGLVLKPPEGGPPTFPEQGDVVLSALNLYRYILMTESAGKTNYTGVLSKDNLQKAHEEWLLPLRTLVTMLMADSQSDCDQDAVDVVCSLNPVEFVLYRCIELVEEKLKHLR